MWIGAKMQKRNMKDELQPLLLLHRFPCKQTCKSADTLRSSSADKLVRLIVCMNKARPHLFAALSSKDHISPSHNHIHAIEPAFIASSIIFNDFSGWHSLSMIWTDKFWNRNEVGQTPRGHTLTHEWQPCLLDWAQLLFRANDWIQRACPPRGTSIPSMKKHVRLVNEFRKKKANNFLWSSCIRVQTICIIAVLTQWRELKWMGAQQRVRVGLSETWNERWIKGNGDYCKPPLEKTDRQRGMPRYLQVRSQAM